jgi:hypothetical protein
MTNKTLTEGQKRYRKYKESYKKYRKNYNLLYKKRDNDKYRFGGMREVALERDEWRCVHCGMSQEQHMIIFNISLTVDHIDGKGIYSKVKNNDLDNLQTLCLRCHGKKDIKKRKWRPTK